ncbi:Glyoxalase/Bleomycin resistance protein/Dihydroxybiphenyl dioxygenase [Cladorrhinum samala]|uniref:Glyoxalase/Bleomycin resistance protein/Dihydroxybiphenyl dioxygenase n=1 Tax=Cladorrhinum samala TaxID=585594 RepID=A0AAV9HWC2_9PEZI|nr:Glyoxalase/Bleomycin resistance protein/Dihydroxybiphenyl dioxygenase [Cladorrhinum samala]
MVIAHTGLRVPQSMHTATVAFYAVALAPLGYTKALSLFNDSVVGFADADGTVDWWVSVAQDGVAQGGHTAFRAKDRATVDRFYEAAISAGAKDNGKPGPRPYSGPHYYGAYVFDPAGNNIEAVTEKPE